MKILYVNVIEGNAGWGAEWFVDKGFRALGHPTTCIDYRKHRQRLPEIFKDLPEHDAFLLQRGDFFPLELVRAIHCPRFFWASELVSRCRDQDRLLASGLFDHVFFHSMDCVRTAVSRGWVERQRCSVLLNGFDESVHRPLPDMQQDIDVLFVGHITPRRKRILERLEPLFRISVVSAFGEELVRLFNRSRIVLNIHAEDFKDTETRVFETLGCRAFLLSEKLSVDNPFSGEHLVEFDTFEELCDKIRYYLDHEKERMHIAEKGYTEALTRHTYTRRAGEIAQIMSGCLKNAACSAAHARPSKGSGIESSPGGLMKTENRTAGTSLVTEGSRPLSDNPPLRIFAAFSQNNWEDYNLLPALRTFGEVVRYDWQPRYNQYDPQWHWGGKQRMNMELLDAVHRAHREAPIDLFFGYLSGRLAFPSTIRTLGMMGIPSLNISLDDRTKFYGELEPTGFAGMADLASAFSLCWTTEQNALENYRSVGARAIFMPPGANHEVFHPHPMARDIDVCFVGQNYGKRAQIISRLREEGIQVRTFGAGWDSGEIPLDEMVGLFSRARITLGIGLVADSPDVVCLKGRDFEVPMSGGFYLTQHHPNLAEFFELGKEIVCYHSPEDMVEKIRHFLNHPGEAEEIRQAGLRRALREHTWTGRFQKALETLDLLSGKAKDGAPESRGRSIGVNTRDDWTYYLRVGKENAEQKKDVIRKFVLSKTGIRTILDVGCNTGEISAQFIPHGIKVLGMDASDRLSVREGYDFLQRDITQLNEILLSDCTFFLSLYHHIFNSRGKDFSDRIFYNLLLRTKVLVFDSGTVEEQGKDREHWIRALRQSFSSEKELLDHFGLPYQIIGSWRAGGARRSIAVFEKKFFDEQAEIVDEFRRKIGSSAQAEGIFSVHSQGPPEDYFEKTRFFKLKLKDRLFFAKKHLSKEWEDVELRNIMEVSRFFPPGELISFYGLSDRYGLVYEWVDRIRYLGKLRDVILHNVYLRDADVVEADGRTRYIDFWSDPESEKGPGGHLPDLETIGRLMEQGESLFQNGDPQHAIPCFEKALILFPRHVEAMNNLGVIAFHLGDIDRAIHQFHQALSLHGYYPEALENMGRCFEAKGDFREASVWFQKALQSGEEKVEILNKLGNCLIQTGDIQRATEIYPRSLQRDPSQELVTRIMHELEKIGTGE